MSLAAVISTAWRRPDAEGARVFGFGRWATALFLLGGPLMGAIAVGVLWQVAMDPPTSVGAAMFMAVLAIGVLALAAASVWYAVGAVRGRPMLRIDGSGIVWGGDWDRDLAVGWQNVRRLRVRTVTSNGITDMQVIPELFDERPVRTGARGFAQRATLGWNRFYYGAPLGVSTVYLAGGYDAVIEAIQRHYRGPIEAA